MSWYVAELVVYCRAGKLPKGRMLYDRQVKVLRASTHEAAYQRALQLGKKENHSYKNSAGEKVSWRFAGLGSLQALLDKEISDGTEICSRLERGRPKSKVRRKKDLAVFWAERNKHKTARELLNSGAKPLPPRR
jgi:hypothetical protein